MGGFYYLMNAIIAAHMGGWYIAPVNKENFLGGMRQPKNEANDGSEVDGNRTDR